MGDKQSAPGPESQSEANSPAPQASRGSFLRDLIELVKAVMTEPFSEVLSTAFGHLKGQHLLVFTLAGAVILLIGGVMWGADTAAILVIPVVAVLAMGVLAWSFVESRKERASQTHIRTGSVRTGLGSRVEGDVRSGSIIYGNAPVQHTQEVDDKRNNTRETT